MRPEKAGAVHANAGKGSLLGQKRAGVVTAHRPAEVALRFKDSFENVAFQNGGDSEDRTDRTSWGERAESGGSRLSLDVQSENSKGGAGGRGRKKQLDAPTITSTSHERDSSHTPCFCLQAARRPRTVRPIVATLCLMQDAVCRALRSNVTLFPFRQCFLGS